MPHPVPDVFSGPARPLPGRADRIAERWARLPWRLRMGLSLLGLLLALSWHVLQIADARMESGPVRPVWIAATTLAPGADGTDQYRQVDMPEALIPPLAVEKEPSTPPVITLVEGSVATRAHFDGIERGPEAAPGFRPVAITSTDADLFAPGSLVDLWDIRVDTPSIVVARAVVIRVDHRRVVVAIPEALAGQIVTLQTQDAIQLAPAGPTVETDIPP